MMQVQTILSSNFSVIMFWDAYEIKLTNISTVWVWRAPMILHSFGANGPEVDKGG